MITINVSSTSLFWGADFLLLSRRVVHPVGSEGRPAAQRVASSVASTCRNFPRAPRSVRDRCISSRM